MSGRLKKIGGDTDGRHILGFIHNRGLGSLESRFESNKQKVVVGWVIRLRALSLLKAAILQHGTKIGSLDGSRIFRSGGSTYLVQLEYSSGDLFMLFPQTVFYKIEDDKLSEFVGDLVKLVEKRRLE